MRGRLIYQIPTYGWDGIVSSLGFNGHHIGNEVGVRSHSGDANGGGRAAGEEGWRVLFCFTLWESVSEFLLLYVFLLLSCTCPRLFPSLASSIPTAPIARTQCADLAISTNRLAPCNAHAPPLVDRGRTILAASTTLAAPPYAVQHSIVPDRPRSQPIAHTARTARAAPAHAISTLARKYILGTPSGRTCLSERILRLPAIDFNASLHPLLVLHPPSTIILGSYMRRWRSQPHVVTALLDRDTAAIVEHTKRIATTRSIETLELEIAAIMKGKFGTFMQQIYERPESVVDTMRGRVNFDWHQNTLSGLHAYALLPPDGVHCIRDELPLVVRSLKS
ncbi:hypothetical protein C8R45DRAFT_1091438 [Mycena sanguinolenta]|nr:hypothetical protein C8R45DRAFT_1091438 [Mycena sanguinolenta]